MKRGVRQPFFGTRSGATRQMLQTFKWFQVRKAIFTCHISEGCVLGRRERARVRVQRILWFVTRIDAGIRRSKQGSRIRYRMLSRIITEIRRDIVLFHTDCPRSSRNHAYSIMVACLSFPSSSLWSASMHVLGTQRFSIPLQSLCNADGNIRLPITQYHARYTNVLKASYLRPVQGRVDRVSPLLLATCCEFRCC